VAAMMQQVIKLAISDARLNEVEIGHVAANRHQRNDRTSTRGIA
jgi:hypothetical protein